MIVKNIKRSLICCAVFLTVFILSGCTNYEDQERIYDLQEQVYESQERVDELEQEVEDYADALFEANNNIENLNNQIEDAKYNAWATYDEMGEALDNLYTERTIDAP